MICSRCDGFPTTSPNAVVEPIHPKAMPLILTTDKERDICPLPDNALQIVMRGADKEDKAAA